MRDVVFEVTSCLIFKSDVIFRQAAADDWLDGFCDATRPGNSAKVRQQNWYRLSHIKFHSVIGRRRITIQPPLSGLVKFNM